jgi:alkylation response protein AidB-like acyl-CoA dehydrogenase
MVWSLHDAEGHPMTASESPTAAPPTAAPSTAAPSTTAPRAGDGPPKEGLLERVTALVPMVSETSFEAEEQRRPLDHVIEALRETGVFRSFVPSRYGGYEIDLETFFEIGVALSRADPSMGWITTFYMEHNWLLTMFPDELQDEVFGDRPYVLAPGSVNPMAGTAVPQDDGTFLLSGHWQFGTGICHADHVLLSGKIEGDESGIPRNFLVEVDQVEVKDTWHVDGMAATGSRDIIATEVPVPAHHVSLAIPPGFFAGPEAPYLVRIPLAPMLSLTAAMPALGAAQRAVELFRERLFERIQFGTTRTQAKRVPSQLRLVNLMVEIDAAETILRDMVRRMQAHADGELTWTLNDQQLQRLTIAHVVRRCRDVVRSVLEASGASVHFLDNEIQRLHRDVHMIAAHTVFDVDLLAEGIGREMVREREAQVEQGQAG